MGEFRTIGAREKTQPTEKTPPDPGRPRGVSGKGRGWWAGLEGRGRRPRAAAGWWQRPLQQREYCRDGKAATLIGTPGKPAPRLRLRGAPGKPELERLRSAPRPEVAAEPRRGRAADRARLVRRAQTFYTAASVRGGCAGDKASGERCPRSTHRAAQGAGPSEPKRA